jgi:UDP-N-acetylglucosamine 2-epimerase (non-hydrolysing)
MHRHRIVSIFGTRPEAIKIAPLVLALRDDPRFESLVCVTAQHRGMLDQVLEQFHIAPDYDLNLMTPGQSLHELTARVVTSVGNVLAETAPDIVLVQGDTTTCLAAALAAYYHSIPVGHLEAGLRTGHRYSPFPEETNRVLTSHLSSLHFAPTPTARANLLREGISPDTVWVTGNTVVDAVRIIQTDLRESATPPLIWLPPTLREAIVDHKKPLILITGHRRESFGSGFQNICTALQQLAAAHPTWVFVYPVHLNPNVQGPVFAMLGSIPNIYLLDPLPYREFVELMQHAKLILTDSGGIQEESLSLGKPLVVMRDTTERAEAVEGGYAVLVGTDPAHIVATTQRIMTEPATYARMCCNDNPYGDGNAATRIVQILVDTILTPEETLKTR